jgi:hypothetical protein
MHKEILHVRVLIVLLLTMPILVLDIHSVAATSVSETRIHIEPPSVVDPTYTPGSRFTVNILVSDVFFEFGCYSWQLNMSWDPTVLKFLNVAEGTFLQAQPEGTVGASRIEDSWALFGWCTLGRHLGVSGSGTLATVEFLVAGYGESVIRIDHPLTYLLSVPLFDIPCLKQDGHFSNLHRGCVPSTVVVVPSTLNLKSQGRWALAFVELPDGYDVKAVDVSTIRLNGLVPTELHRTKVGDYDKDVIPDLMFQFSRHNLRDTVRVGEAALTITGEVDGTRFQGTALVRVIAK